MPAKPAPSKTRKPARADADPFRLLFKNHPLPMWIYDLETLAFLEVNDAAVEQYGYTRREFLKMTLKDIRPAGEVERLLEDVKKKRPPLRHPGEWRHRRKDGSLLDVETTSHTLEYQGRKAALVTVQDVTERKRADKALQENNQFVTSLLRAIPVAVFFKDREGKYIGCNDVFTEIMGTRAEEIRGKTVHELWPSELAQVYHEKDLELMRNRQHQVYEFKVKDKNGGIRPVIFAKDVFLDAKGEPAGMVGAFLDITERRQIEEKLRERETRYRSLFEDSPVSIWEEDFSAVKQRLDALRAEGVDDFRSYFVSHPHVVAECASLVKVLDVNKATLKMQGARQKEDLLTSLAQVFGEKFFREFQGELLKIANGQTTFDWEGVNQTLSGETLIVNMRWSAVPGHEQNLDRVIVSLTDVTERRQAEKQLQESESRYRDLVERTSAVIYNDAVDESSSSIYMSPSIEDLLGYTAEEWMADPYMWTRLLHPEDRERVLEQHLRTNETGKPFKSEYRLIHRDGSAVWVSDDATLLRDETGKPLYWQGVLLDITERKQAEEARRITLAKYQTLFDSFPLGITISDEAGNILETNPMAERLLGVSQEEHIQRDIDSPEWQIVHPDGTPMPADEYASVRALKEQRLVENVEMGIVKPDGSTTWISVTAAPLPLEGYGVAITYSDITERKRMEDQLRIKEWAIAGSINGIALADLTGNLTFVNPAFLTMWGYEVENDVLGRNSNEFWQTKDKAANAMAALRQNGNWRGELIGKRCDGFSFIAEVAASQVTNEAGRPLCLLGVFADITDRKQAEEALHESEERYRTLFTRILDGIYRSTHEGKFLEVNPAMVDMFGYSSKEEMLGIDIQNELYFDPGERGSHILDTGKQGIEVYRMRRKDGSEIWVEDHGTYVHDEHGNIIFHEGILRDVTARVRAEEALRKSERENRRLSMLLRLMADTMPDMLWAKNLDKEYIFANQSICENLLNAADTKEPLGKTDMFFAQRERQAHPEDPNWHTFGELCRDSDSITLQEMRPMQFDEFGNVKGEFLYLDVHKAPLYDEDGQLIGLVGSARDVTARKQAEEALRASETRLASIFRINPGAIAVTRLLDSRLVDFNQAWEEATGYSREEALGRTPIELGLWGKPEQRERLVEMLREQDRARGEIQIRRKTGEVRELLMSAELVELAGERYMLSIAQDITERKKIQEALRIREERLRLVMTVANDGLWDWDLTTNEVYFDPRYYLMAGYEVDEFPHRLEEFQQRVHPDDLAYVMEEGQKHLDGQTDRFEVEFHFRKKDGGYIWILGQGRIVARDEQGKPLRFVGTHSDITKRKQAEEALHKSERRFRALIENSNDMILLLHPEGTICYASPSVQHIMGYVPENLVGRNVFELIHPEDLARVNSEMLQTVRNPRGLPDITEARIRHADGSWHIHEGVGTNLLDDPAVASFVLNSRDVTERKRADQALRESHDRILLILDSIPADVYVADLETHEILFMNLHMREKFGDNLIGQKCWEVFRDMPGPCPNCTNDRLVDPQGDPTQGATWEGQNPLTRRWYKNYDRAIRWSNRRLVRLQIAVDLTEQKQAEEEIRKHNEDLALLDTINAAANRGESLAFIVNLVSTETKRIFNSLGMTLHLLDEERGALVMQNLSVHPSLLAQIEKLVGRAIPPIAHDLRKNHPYRGVLEGKQGLLLNDPLQIREFIEGYLEATPWTDKTRQRVKKFIPALVALLNYKSLLVVPLFSGNKIIGTLDTGSQAQFTENDLRRLEAIAGQLTAVIDRKRTEEKLRQSEESYTGLFNTVSEAIYIQDADGVFLNVNEGAIRMYGYAREELVGKTPEFVSAPGRNDLPEIFRMVRQVLATGAPKAFEFWGRRKNGEVFPKECIASRGRYFGREVIIVTARDITERKRAEEQRREAEYRYHALFEQSHDAIFILDFEGAHLDVNRRAADMLGYSVEEICGLSVQDTSAEVPQSLEIIQRLVNGEPIPLYERFFRKKNGEMIPVEINVELVRDAHGNPLHIQSVVRDITERKRAEEEIKRLNADLEQRVEERTRELRDAQEQLVRQEKLAVMGQLAGGVGHELRNPLAVITNAVYFLKLIQPQADEKVREYLGMIERETHTAEKIISDLLDFARVKSVEREAVSISALVDSVLARYPTPGSVTVSLEIPPGLPPLYADPHHMEQILGNLIVNAYQAMKDGGRLTVDSGQSIVEGQPWVRIAVKDTGIGIPPENLPKLFEPLFTTKAQGIGLGLAVSRKLAEANGGRIEVQSEAGRGSTFTLHVPAFEGEV